MPVLSVVTTLYYSENYIEEFYKRIKNVITQLNIEDYEIIIVNDGSPDNSLVTALSLREKDNSVVVIDLSRNFGHHQALLTGLQHAEGEMVFLIDSDLEEPPELLQNYWTIYQEEKVWDVIYGIQARRKGKTFERQSGSLFYKLLNHIVEKEYPSDSLTARLMKQSYVKSVLSFPEKDLELWSIFLLAGYRQKAVLSGKSDKGSSTYTFSKKTEMAFRTVTALSYKPLYWIFYAGVLLTIISCATFTGILIYYLIYPTSLLHYFGLFFSGIGLVSGVILVSLGIVGIYISKVLTEVRNRPLSIIKKRYGKQ
jgi:putative glycosyltransferase